MELKNQIPTPEMEAKSVLDNYIIAFHHVDEKDKEYIEGQLIKTLSHLSNINNEDDMFVSRYLIQILKNFDSLKTLIDSHRDCNGILRL